MTTTVYIEHPFSYSISSILIVIIGYLEHLTKFRKLESCNKIDIIADKLEEEGETFKQGNVVIVIGYSIFKCNLSRFLN